MRAATGKKLSGLYLVADLSLPEEKLISAVENAVRGGVQIVQIWNATRAREQSTVRICDRISIVVGKGYVPLIVHNDLNLAKKIDASGVHFDEFHTPAQDARKVLGLDAIVGYTCGNNQDMVRKAESLGADYLSFCAVFPSPSVYSCEIVPLESVRQAKRTVSTPVFASGGITLENAHLVMEAGADGLAIASSILSAEDPEAKSRAFRQIIDKYLTARAGASD
ncbi:MAG: thiamine phosphate synthase [Candidatus Bathyarchaeia archaeon]|jgi:thiamine-phosphate pyrophosphorylase